MRSSNPVFTSLTKATVPSGQRQAGQFGYANPAAGYGYAGPQGGYGATAPGGYGYAGDPRAAARAITIDDIVTKTGIVLGVIIVVAAINFGLALTSPGIGMLLTMVGAIGGLVTVMISSLGNKYGSAAVTLTYAVFEGLFVGGVSFLFAGVTVKGASGFSIIVQAVLGTIGVFIGMLYVYKTGAIKVTSTFRRVLTGCIVGVLVLVIGNMLLGLIFHTTPLSNGGPIAIVFSLVCIVLAALSFLTDFDAADRLVRAGAPAQMAWGVALGLAVTLVWLYTEILRLLSYMRN